MKCTVRVTAFVVPVGGACPTCGQTDLELTAKGFIKVHNEPPAKSGPTLEQAMEYAALTAIVEAKPVITRAGRVVDEPLPLDDEETLPRVTPASDEHPIKNDVQATLWRGYPGNVEHALSFPVGGVLAEGEWKAACNKVLEGSRIGAAKDARCKACVKALARTSERVSRHPGKMAKPLSESLPDNITTGTSSGDPKAAEDRRAAEIDTLRGKAPGIHAKMQQDLNASVTAENALLRQEAAERAQVASVQLAQEAQRIKDEAACLAGNRPGPAYGLDNEPRTGTVPVTVMTEIPARVSGAAMVRGRDMAPVQPVHKSGAFKGEPLAWGTMHGPLGREHTDRKVTTVLGVGGLPISKGGLSDEAYRALSKRRRKSYWGKRNSLMTPSEIAAYEASKREDKS